ANVSRIGQRLDSLEGRGVGVESCEARAARLGSRSTPCPPGALARRGRTLGPGERPAGVYGAPARSRSQARASGVLGNLGYWDKGSNPDAARKLPGSGDGSYNG